MSSDSPTVGILGGMGPAATAEFLAELTQLTPASRDQDNISSIVISDTLIPDRTEAILTGIDTVTPRLRHDAEQLASWGADLLAVPCNTAHFFLERFAGELSIPLISIVEATLDSAVRLSDPRRRGSKDSVREDEHSHPIDAWLACTRGTLASRLYQQAAERKKVQLRIPSTRLFSEFSAIIALVKEGNTRVAGQRWAKAEQRLRGIADAPVLLACTELPLAARAAREERERFGAEDVGAQEVSSLQALAEAVIVACGKTPLSWRKLSARSVRRRQ